MTGLRTRVTLLVRATVRRLRGHDLALYSAGVTFYAGIALVPSVLVAVRFAALLAGESQVLKYSEDLADALPEALGAPDVARSLFTAGVDLPWLGVLIAILPATLYGEGLRRAFVALSDRGDALVGWRGRARVAPLLAAAPALLLVVLSITPLLSRLFGTGEFWPVVLGVYVALNVDWIVLAVTLTYVYRVVGPDAPSWRSALWGGAVVGAFVSGFLQGFVLFLTIPVDLGAPFGGFVPVGAAVAVGLWLWLLHGLTLVGYRLTLEIEAARGADMPTARPRSVSGAGRT